MEAAPLLTSTQLLRCVARTQASRCLLPVPPVFCLNQLIECERLVGPDMKDNHMAGAALRRSVVRGTFHTCKLGTALLSFRITLDRFGKVSLVQKCPIFFMCPTQNYVHSLYFYFIQLL